MKKTYKITHDKIKPARLIDSVKHDVKKYLKRERNKQLPKGVDFWDFDCKYGINEEEADVVHVSELNKYIDEAETNKLKSFYIEILAAPGYRNKKEESKD